ncbi:hypothetical protein [Chitinophaga nivalis]|uniref:DUF4126 domain-containing protein n=1 Tax=Chitinophaga nivalis TaxID=2991709 RepID=A0ABT3IFA9_9BACT|nr:hypothetical protein [Chitinophaga nivalis]MCW3467654.1 hypothetical protein [Chitinophaga nivalis]MCW3482654.1 hypothetical protein [Chitinophaga nivalis]
MKKVTISTFIRVLGLGIVSGMRGAMGPAFASYYVNKHPSRELNKSPLGFMKKEATGKFLQTMAAGELVIDKAPSTGDRTTVTGLTGRALSGGLVGATLYQAKGDKAWQGALIGAAAAVAGAYAFFYLRQYAGKKLKVRDAAVGGVEDAIAVGIAAGAVMK